MSATETTSVAAAGGIEEPKPASEPAQVETAPPTA